MRSVLVALLLTVPAFAAVAAAECVTSPPVGPPNLLSAQACATVTTSEDAQGRHVDFEADSDVVTNARHSTTTADGGADADAASRTAGAGAVIEGVQSPNAVLAGATVWEHAGLSVALLPDHIDACVRVIVFVVSDSTIQCGEPIGLGPPNPPPIPPPLPPRPRCLIVIDGSCIPA